jgi:hypothetical protein
MTGFTQPQRTFSPTFLRLVRSLFPAAMAVLLFSLLVWPGLAYDFSNAFRLSTNLPYKAFNPDIAARGEYVAVVWSEGYNSNSNTKQYGRVYLKGADQTSGWRGRVELFDATQGVWGRNPRLVFDPNVPGKVHVVWAQATGCPTCNWSSIQYTTCTIGSPTTCNSPTTVVSERTDASTPDVAVDASGGVHVVWHEGPLTGVGTIKYCKKGSCGSPSTVDSGQHPSLAYANGYLHLVWDTGSATNSTIKYARENNLDTSSWDGGNGSHIWWGNPALVSYYDPSYPAIGANNDAVYVVWAVRNKSDSSKFALAFDTSLDTGANWLAGTSGFGHSIPENQTAAFASIWHSTGDVAAELYSLQPTVVVTGSGSSAYAHVVWQDRDVVSGVYRIWYSYLEGYTESGTWTPPAIVVAENTKSATLPAIALGATLDHTHLAFVQDAKAAAFEDIDVWYAGPYAGQSDDDQTDKTSLFLPVILKQFGQIRPVPDLEVTKIQFPPGPPINEEIPVAVTVFNNSPVSASGAYFDVDLYLDPPHPPTTSSPFPPGDYKRWMYSAPAMGTSEVVFNIILRGTNHTIYGRVDTSNYIPESNEENNIYQTTISGRCVSEIGDALSSAANWTGVGYGDADNGSFSVGSGIINLVSDGSSDFGSSDNMYLAYYNPQTIAGDFEVRVRMLEGPGDDGGESDWARAGLEIRGDVGNASSNKVDLAVSNSQHVGFHPAVQSAYRDGGNASRPDDAALDVGVAYPVWLRIVRSGNRFLYYYSDSDSATPPAGDAWTPHGSVQMANIGEAVTVALFNAAYDDNKTDTSSFEKFYICLKGVEAPPAGEDLPPGLTVCSGNLVQNGGFENVQLAPWTTPNGAVNRNSDQYQGEFSALMYTYMPVAHQQPVLAQTFNMPEWVISSTTTIDLSLYTCARDLPGSGAEPADHLNAELQTVASTRVSTPTLVANGNTANSGPCAPQDFVPYSTDLAAAIKAAEGNPEDYAGQSLKLFMYDFSSDLGICNAAGGGPFNPACYETDYRLDNVELQVCTTQPVPYLEPGKAIIGGPLRVFLSGTSVEKPGVPVWIYIQNSELLTTYSLHDSNYFFYNVEPGEYLVYSEYWDGPNLFSAFTPVIVGPGQTITNLSLLLR